jgi:hypothetical protein
VLSKGSLHQEIRAVQIDAAGRPRWREKYWGTLEQWYRRAAFWDDYAADLHHALWMETTSLAELNGRIVDVLLRAFGIDVTVRRASDLEVSGKRGDLLLDICRRLGADGYLSGVSGREYLDVSAFERAGVGVQFQEFHHPVYRQRYEPFMPCMSSVDLLFNQGPGSADVLRGVGVELMDEVFS